MCRQNKLRSWVEVVAQLAYQSLPIPEVRGSKPVLLNIVYRKSGKEWPIKNMHRYGWPP